MRRLASRLLGLAPSLADLGLSHGEVRAGVFDSATVIAHFGRPPGGAPVSFACDPQRAGAAWACATRAAVKVVGADGTELTKVLGTSAGEVRGVSFCPSSSLLVVTSLGVHSVELGDAIAPPLSCDLGGASATCFDHLWYEPCVLCGTENGDVRCVVIGRDEAGRVTSLCLSQVVVTYGQISENEDHGAKGPPVSLLKINPACTSLVMTYHGTPFKILTAWDLATSSVHRRYLLRDMAQVTAVTWHAKGDRFVSAHDDGKFFLWKTKDEAKPQASFFLGVPLFRTMKIALTKRDKEDLLVLHGKLLSASGGAQVAAGGEGQTFSLQIVRSPWKDKLRKFLLVCDTSCDFDLVYQGPHAPGSGNPIALSWVEGDSTACRLPFGSGTAVCLPSGSAAFLSASPVTCIRKSAGSQPFSIACPGTQDPVTTKDPPADPLQSSLLLTGHADGTVNIWEVLASGGLARRMVVSGYQEGGEASAVSLLEIWCSDGFLCLATRSGDVFLFEHCGAQRQRSVLSFSQGRVEGQLTSSRFTIAADPEKLCEPGFQLLLKGKCGLKVESLCLSRPEGGILGMVLGSGELVVIDRGRTEVVKKTFETPATYVSFVRVPSSSDRSHMDNGILVGLGDGSLVLLEGLGDTCGVRKLKSSAGSPVVDVMWLGNDASVRPPVLPSDGPRLFALVCHATFVCLCFFDAESRTLRDVRRTGNLRTDAPLSHFGLVSLPLSLPSLPPASTPSVAPPSPVGISPPPPSSPSKEDKALPQPPPIRKVLLACDDTLVVSAIALMQCVEARRLDYSCIPLQQDPSKPGSGPFMMAISEDGRLYISCGDSLSVVAVFGESPVPLVLADPVPCPESEKQKPPGWLSSLPAPRPLLTLFAPPPLPAAQAAEVTPSPPPSKTAPPDPGKNDELAKVDKSVGAAAQTMREAQDALRERGEQLSKMEDHTADLAVKASEFARLCHELAQKHR